MARQVPVASTQQVVMADDPDFIPPLLQQRLSIDFMENRVVPERRLPVKYSRRENTFVPNPRTASFGKEQDIAKRAETQVRREDQLKTLTRGWFDAVETLSRTEETVYEVKARNYQEVLDAVKGIEQTYYSKDTASGTMRAYCRKINEKADCVTPWLELLPDGMYKTLCGGLKLAIGAMKKHTEIRELMLELVAELPDIAEHAVAYIGLYGDAVSKQVDGVYTKVMSILQEIVKWYNQSSMKRAMKATFQGPQFGNKIKEGIKDLRKAQDQLKVEIEKCLHRSVNKAAVASELANRLTDTLDEQLAQRRYSQMCSQEMFKCFQAMHTEMMTLKADLKSALNAPSPQGNGTRQILPHDGAYTRHRLMKKLELTGRPPQPSDIEEITREGHASSLSFQGCTEWFLGNPTFRRWLTNTESSMLLLDQGQDSMDRLSSLSYLVALLVQRLSQDSSILVIPLFCGLVSWASEDESPEVALARYLLHHILARDEFHSLPADAQRQLFSCLSKSNIQKMCDRSFKAYLKAIRLLLARIRVAFSEVFILIDGVDFLETQGDMNVVAIYEFLTQISSDDLIDEGMENVWEDNGPPAAVKVLCCASARACAFPSPTDRISVLQMSEEARQSHSDFDEITWERTAVAIRQKPVKKMQKLEALSDGDEDVSDND